MSFLEEYPEIVRINTHETGISKILLNCSGLLKKLEEVLDVKINHRGEELTLMSKNKELLIMVEDLLLQLADLEKSGKSYSKPEVTYAIQQISKGIGVNVKSLHDEIICINSKGKQILPYTLGQKYYVEAIYKNDITFGIGPAGTGKTYLAVAVAVSMLKKGDISRIVLVRPVVEAGESLGYLPGDLTDKVTPYLRPLYDSFYDLISPERFTKLMDKGVIELAPLAYMRGRTLNDSFIILDEAQNTTPQQMKMFLTRLGFGSKAVVTGDTTQVDLPGNKESGLKVVQRILDGIEGISFSRLSNSDVVRHEIVKRIVRAYENYESSR